MPPAGMHRAKSRGAQALGSMSKFDMSREDQAAVAEAAGHDPTTTLQGDPDCCGLSRFARLILRGRAFCAMMAGNR